MADRLAKVVAAMRETGMPNFQLQAHNARNQHLKELARWARKSLTAGFENQLADFKEMNRAAPAKRKR